MRPTLPEARAALAVLSAPRRRWPLIGTGSSVLIWNRLSRSHASLGGGIAAAHRAALVSRYRRFGLAGLSRAARADDGKRRRVSDELRRLVEGLAVQEPLLGPGAIYREVCRVAQIHGQAPPGYHTIYNVIRGARFRRS